LAVTLYAGALKNEDSYVLLCSSHKRYGGLGSSGRVDSGNPCFRSYRWVSSEKAAATNAVRARAATSLGIPESCKYTGPDCKERAEAAKARAAKLDSRDAIQNAAEDRLPFDMPEVYALVRALDSIELYLLPASLISSAMIVGATFRQFRIKVDMVFDTHRKMDGAAFADFFETMKQMQESMRLTVADLDEELKAAT
jgi:hypothetical protein